MQGDLSKTRDANRLAHRVAYLMELNYQKNVDYVLEQPSSSILFRYKCIRDLGLVFVEILQSRVALNHDRVMSSLTLRTL